MLYYLTQIKNVEGRRGKVRVTKQTYTNTLIHTKGQMRWHAKDATVPFFSSKELEGPCTGSGLWHWPWGGLTFSFLWENNLNSPFFKASVSYGGKYKDIFEFSRANSSWEGGKNLYWENVIEVKS